MSFEIVKLGVEPRICPAPLAVTVEEKHVVFRLDAALAKECGAKRGTLYALGYDDKAGLVALVEDPGNKSGYAAKALTTDVKKSTRATVTFPRVDLLARIFPEPKPITALTLFEKRAPGKVVFHIPEKRKS